ncbi:MAG TPA: hypothetical protein PLD55_10060 [bacterium]|nr:hypothetical protein [bacterium]
MKKYVKKGKRVTQGNINNHQSTFIYYSIQFDYIICILVEEERKKCY